MNRYAIFDLDGTLLDSMPIWDNIGAEFLKSNGVTPPLELNQVLRAMSLEQSAQYFINQFGIRATVEEIMAKISRMVRDHYYYRVPMKPTVPAFLEHLKKNRVRMSIATASEKNHVVAALTRLQAMDYFEFILTCTELGVGKDDPAIFLTAAQKWGAAPQEVTVFEDALHAIKTTKKAGFYTVGVFDHYAAKETAEIQKICDRYIINFEELTKEN